MAAAHLCCPCPILVRAELAAGNSCCLCSAGCHPIHEPFTLHRLTQHPRLPSFQPVQNDGPAAPAGGERGGRGESEFRQRTGDPASLSGPSTHLQGPQLLYVSQGSAARGHIRVPQGDLSDAHLCSCPTRSEWGEWAGGAWGGFTNPSCCLLRFSCAVSCMASRCRQRHSGLFFCIPEKLRVVVPLKWLFTFDPATPPGDRGFPIRS